MFFWFKQKTAYEMRISDWSSDVCSSDLLGRHHGDEEGGRPLVAEPQDRTVDQAERIQHRVDIAPLAQEREPDDARSEIGDRKGVVEGKSVSVRVDLGGRRIIKNKSTITNNQYTHTIEPHLLKSYI